MKDGTVKETSGEWLHPQKRVVVHAHGIGGLKFWIFITVKEHTFQSTEVWKSRTWACMPIWLVRLQAATCRSLLTDGLCAYKLQRVGHS